MPPWRRRAAREVLPKTRSGWPIRERAWPARFPAGIANRTSPVRKPSRRLTCTTFVPTPTTRGPAPFRYRVT